MDEPPRQVASLPTCLSNSGVASSSHDCFSCALGELMMSLLWYYRPEHLQGGRSPSMHEVSCLAGRVGGRGGEGRGCGTKEMV